MDKERKGKNNTLLSLDSCFNKRVFFNNELSFEQRFENKMMLFAGDPMSDQVLHK
jgi:hypothetical protein